MKLFVVLLALWLTAAEKLNRRYLPPPGAKFAGGHSDDLQTPLEYTKGTLTYGENEYGSTVYANDDTDNVKIGSSDENELSSMLTNAPSHKSLSNLRSGFDSGHMPKMAVLESVGQNYMYSGNPMSIKHFDNNIEMAGSDDLVTSDEKTNLPKEKEEPKVRPLQNIRYPQVEQYQATRQGHSTGTITTLGRNGQNETFEKIERPQANTDGSAIVLNYKNVQTPDRYFYNFDTSNGIHRDESVSTAKGFIAKGSYSYKGDDGKVYTVTYTADENGFQASGDHLPPISEAIQNVIKQAKRDKDAGIVDDGSYDETKYGHMKYQGPVHRYMQKNAKTHTRKKVSGEEKMLGSTQIIKHETNNIMTSRSENLQSQQNKNRKPFGMRRVQLIDNRRNEEDDMFFQSPKTKEYQDYTTLHYDYSQKVNNNKVVSNGMVLQNIQSNRGFFNSNKKKNFEIPAIQDGYFYVPPENVFVDGKYQDKLTYNNKSVLVTVLKVDDNRNENDKLLDKNISSLKMTQLIISTEKPLNQQTNESDLYVSIYSDVDQSIDNTRTTSKASPSKKLETETTKQLYSNTLSTKLYDNEFTDDIVQEEETVIPKNREEIDFLSAQNDSNTANYDSTTPMSSEARYTIQTYGNTNQYETTSSESALTSSNFDIDYSENYGSFKITPEKPATFEDFPSLTYSPYTIHGIVSTAESTKNYEEDEFGRTRQDSFGYITDSSTDSFTNGMQSDNESKSSTPYDDYEETFRTDKPTTLDNKLITHFSSEFGSVVNKTPDDLHLGRDTIIGEDFTGPKQSQRYDPKNGYYY